MTDPTLSLGHGATQSPNSAPTDIMSSAVGELTPMHFVNIANGRFSSTTRADLSAAFANYRASATNGQLPPLVIHFHGGLVNEKAGMATATRLMPEYTAAGGYPLFFVWESGLWEVVSRNLPEIFRETIFKRLVRRVMQFAVGKAREVDGEKGLTLALPDDLIVRDELARAERGVEPFAGDEARLTAASELSVAQATQFEQALAEDSTVEQEVEAIVNGARDAKARHEEFDGTRGIRVHASTSTLMSPEVVDEICGTDGGSKGLVSTARVIAGALRVLKRVVDRSRKGRGHGLHATIVEELLREFYVANAGGVVWSQMKKDTRDAFDSDAECAGTAFLAELVAMVEKGQRPRVVLVGHSTGAIYICELLDAADKALRNVEGTQPVSFDLVFLAPACTFALLADTIARRRPRIRNLRVFAMRDALEKQDQLIRIEKFPEADPILRAVYPHSLLYFVSGVTEDEPDMPLVGMERYYSGAPPYSGHKVPGVDVARQFMEGLADCSVWAVADDGQGMASDSKRHGDFDETAMTLRSVQRIIEAGYARA